MTDENKRLYLNMVIGTIAMVVAGLGIIRFYSLTHDGLGFGLSLLGISFVNSYVFYLEKKAGIDIRLRLIKSAITIVAFLVLAYFFFL